MSAWERLGAADLSRMTQLVSFPSERLLLNGFETAFMAWNLSATAAQEIVTRQLDYWRDAMDRQSARASCAGGYTDLAFPSELFSSFNTEIAAAIEAATGMLGVAQDASLRISALWVDVCFGVESEAPAGK